MANSSILGGSPPSRRAAGKNVDALGPSDRSDSGSDVQGESTMPTAPDNAGEWGSLPSSGASDSDSLGTGERASAAGRAPRDGNDILPDSVVDDPDAPDGPARDADDAGDHMLVEDDIPADDDADENDGDNDDDAVDPVTADPTHRGRKGNRTH